MISDWLDTACSLKDKLPNRFSIALGELIRKARLEANISQSDLADKAYFRQAAISQNEIGKRDVTASEIGYLRFALNKLITYFYSLYIFNIEKDDDSELTLLDHELVLQAQRLNPDDLKRLICSSQSTN